MVDLIVITGPSGCGLSSAEFVFEELGYYVVKNVPGEAIEGVIDALLKQKSRKIAIVAQVMSAGIIVENLRNNKKVKLRFIILNCDEEELLKRFTLSRRTHPRTVLEKLSPATAIKRDIEDTLKNIPESDLYIDTTSLEVKELRSRLYKYLEDVEEDQITSVTFISFGLKYGIPQGIDTFFDVRAIPNPYWVEDLKLLTGADQPVIDYMMSFPITIEVLNNLVIYLRKFLKDVVKTGRGSYTIGIACSGGQHRSTYVANYLAAYFKNEYRTQAIHRDTPSLNSNTNE